ncbi:MAG TPA: hypothetical protein VM243_16195 [Phycisphaerae bacterium]|nr:hypothetical protein [Phycisphaerae bacterium]
MGALCALCALALSTQVAGCGVPRSASAATSDAGGVTPVDDDAQSGGPQARIEPSANNDTWPIEPGAMAVISGTVYSAEQVDVYDVGPVFTGDHLHVEVTADASLDAAIAVLDQGENVLVANDDRSRSMGLIDPWADVRILHDSEHLYVAVSASPAAPSAGAYTLEALLTEGAVDQPLKTQRVYLNFDGAPDVVIGSRPPVDVPTFDASAIDTAYAGKDEEIIELLVSYVREDYTGLNVDFRSSRNGPPPPEPYTSVHFGTYDAALLGVAENIDEYNTLASQEAIVFVDTFAAFAVLNPTAEEIAHALANVTSHEVGHLLGLYHTADVHGVMDITANLRQMLGDQYFARSPLHAEVFPIGYQDALRVLVDNIGGDLDQARSATAAQRNTRAKWYDGGDGPPARSKHVFGTCACCLAGRAGD